MKIAKGYKLFEMRDDGKLFPLFIGKNEETASHTWNAGVETTEPGCGSEGVKTFTCTDNCGATKTEPIPATGNHTAGRLPGDVW